MSPADPLITFRRVSEHAGIDREQLQRFAETLFQRVARRQSFHCRITGDAELRRLNREHRGKDSVTDILSFPAEDQADGVPYLGDLAISRHRALTQSREHGHSVTEELQLLMLHGVLHLIGLDHERDRGEMARAEKSWRTKLDLPSSLIERVRPTRIKKALTKKTLK